MKKIYCNIAYTLFVVAVILFIWGIASILINVELILPTPVAAFQQFFAYLGTEEFWQSLGGTFYRSMLSFFLAFLIALALSLIAFSSKRASLLIQPLMSIVRAIPTMAVILILTIWLSPQSVPLVVAAVVICPTLYSSFIVGFEQIDTHMIEMAFVYKVPLKKKILKLYIPNMAPILFESSASGLGLNIKLVIAAEALAQTANSIGKLMQYSKIAIETEKLFALTIAAVLLSVLCEVILRLIGKRVVKWKYVKN